MSMFFYEDYSLAEIAAIENISRQATSDLIHRSMRKLENYDSALQLVKAYTQRQELRRNLRHALSKRDYATVSALCRKWDRLEDDEVGTANYEGKEQ